MSFLHIRNISSCLHGERVTIKNERVFLTNTNRDDSLADIDPSTLISIFQAATPSCEIVALGGW